MKLAFIGTYPPRECGIATFTMDLYQSMIGDNKIIKDTLLFTPKSPEGDLSSPPSGGRGVNSSKDSVDGFIIAINDHEQTYNYPEEVKLTIRQEHQRDYLEAVKFINLSGADLCILEHEFGIFGGQSGVYILPLLHRLEIPL
ncbi:MAG: hypothetical protein HYY40_04265, partial [Bacteroidetes bacterium]|nr:hypothetical protein [Bacteroidota bacterium]